MYSTWNLNEEEIMWEMLMCGDITVTASCTDLARHHSVNQIGSTLHSNSYYAGILVPSATSCKTIHGVKSVRN